MNKTIVINKESLKECIKNSRDYYGSSEWKIYTDDQGNVGLRHNTYFNRDYHEIIDLYYWNSCIECTEDDINDYVDNFYVDDKEDCIIVNDQFEQLIINFKIS